MRDAARWVPIPPGSSRWLLPATPRQAAKESLRIYQPVTRKGLAGWEIGRALASLGAFRLLPGRGSPPEEVTQTLRDNGIAFRSLALARANHPARWLALLLDETFRTTGVAKLAFDEQGRGALNREATAIEAAAPFLTGSVRPPRLVMAAEGLLVLAPVDWAPRVAPWRLPAEVAFALGAYSRERSGQGEDMAAHGDFAPWNLLRTKRQWALLDWEHSSLSRPPFFDLWHYLLQGHSLLGRPPARALVAAIDGASGWVRDAIVEYARGCGREPEEAPRYIDDYIKASTEQLAGRSQKEREALSARLRLQHQIDLGISQDESA